MNKHNEQNFITVRKDEKILRAVPQSVMAKYVEKNRTYLNKQYHLLQCNLFGISL